MFFQCTTAKPDFFKLRSKVPDGITKNITCLLLEYTGRIGPQLLVSKFKKSQKKGQILKVREGKTQPNGRTKNEVTNDRTDERTNERTNNEHTNVRTNERTSVRTYERTDGRVEK